MSSVCIINRKKVIKISCIKKPPFIQTAGSLFPKAEQRRGSCFSTVWLHGRSRAVAQSEQNFSACGTQASWDLSEKRLL